MPKSRKRAKPKAKRKTKAEPKWESFERVVAAIHLAEMQGAKVIWNEIIEGRQFDVTIRFKVGFYEYLTVIECRDYNKPIKVDQVEAFVTKARAHNANKAIMVSACGFQSGAKTVARRENIELYSLRQINKLPDDVLNDVFLSFVVVQPVAFRMNTKVAFVFSNDLKTLQYQVENIRFTNYGELNLMGLIRPFMQLVNPTPLPNVPDVEKVGFPYKRATATHTKASWKMMDNTKLIVPDTGEEIPVSEFLFVYFAETVRLRKLGGIDSAVYEGYGKQYEYKNELNDEAVLINAAHLQLGIDTVFQEGRFYRQPQLKNFVYYCEKIEGDLATILLLRSHQHGNLVRMQGAEPLTASKGYIEITDEAEIAEGRKMYEEFLDLRSSTPATAKSENGDVLIWLS